MNSVSRFFSFRIKLLSIDSLCYFLFFFHSVFSLLKASYLRRKKEIKSVSFDSLCKAVTPVKTSMYLLKCSDDRSSVLAKAGLDII